MNYLNFGIFLTTVLSISNAFDDISDFSEYEDEYERIAQFAYEVASIAQSKIDEADESPLLGRDSFDPQLLVAEPQGISRLNLSSTTRWMVERTENIGGLDYHFGRDRMYWSDLSTGCVYSRPLNKRSPKSFSRETFVERSPLSWRPRSIAVDHVTDQLYVTDTVGNTVHVFDLDDSRNAASFKPFLNNPLDIELDPSVGYMFVADDTRLVRAMMDGKSPESIVDQSLYYIRAVALDLAKRRVYWSEHSYRQIKSANYDGSSKRVVLKTEAGNLFNVVKTTDIAFYDSRLYFYDEAHRSISSVLVAGPEDKAVDGSYEIVYDALTIKVLRLIHPSQQQPLKNPCANEQCSERQMCFITAAEASSSQLLGFTCTNANEGSSVDKYRKWK